MTQDTANQATMDPFSQFWTDMFARMNAPQAGAGAGPNLSADAQKQMQRIFFDAMAKYFDDFMRSEQFLHMMKETMDRSLAFKQQVDAFLTQAYRGAQAPARADVDDISGLLRSFEANVLDRLNSLEEKVAAVEDKRRSGRSAGASRAQRPPRRGKMKSTGAKASRKKAR